MPWSFPLIVKRRGGTHPIVTGTRVGMEYGHDAEPKGFREEVSVTPPNLPRTPFAPPPVGTDLVRIATSPDGQRIEITPAVWEDPAAWGILLADLVRHIAAAESQLRPDLSSEAFLDRLFEGFHAELASPTDLVEGGDAPPESEG